MACTSWRGVDERIQWMLDHPPGQAGMCARETWQALGGDKDPPCPPAWGTPNANAVYDQIKASGRYWTHTPIPRGAVIAWRYGANGHAALSAGDGKICTTDPTGWSGGTGIEPLAYPEKWGATPSARVWTDQYNGVRFDIEQEDDNVWTDYSGKPSGTLTITNAQDYEPVDFTTADPPSSGLEFHLLYANCEIAWLTEPQMGMIRVKYTRDGGDDTAYQDYCVPAGEAIGSPDTFLLTAVHWESGEKGVGGRWHIRCEGDIASIKLGTRYAKIGVIG